MDSVGDEAIVATNDDASICKYQAVLKGYYEDEFIGLFLSSRARSPLMRPAPEITRGYYLRSVSIAYLVEQFINTYEHAQVINLGSGYDTLFWRLKSASFARNDQEYPTNKSVNYVEVDMNVVTVHKMLAIKRSSVLQRQLSNIAFKGENLHSDEYHLISFDLRQVDKEPLGKKLQIDCQLDLSRPTLCLTECVLVYMSSRDSSNLIGWLSNNFSKLTMINYEQCNMEDRFGEIMLENMNSRHCNLLGVDSCKSAETQAERYRSQGLPEIKVWTLLDIYNSLLVQSERDRIEKIEFLDEKELLDQLLAHYCIVIASKEPLDHWFNTEVLWQSKTSRRRRD